MTLPPTGVPGVPGADLLIVASHRRWIADDLAAAGVLPVVADPGLDAPVLPRGTRAAWWMPGEHAARVMHAGVNVRLRSAGSGWLARVPRELLGRDVWAGTVADLPSAPPRGWCKPAESKIPALQAGWYDSTEEFQVALALLGVPENEPVHVSATFLDLADEYRCFVAHGQVAAVGAYLRAGQTWDPAWELEPDRHQAAAVAFAQRALDAMGADQPPGFVVDVGRCADGSWVVVEANASWSSGIYGCAPRAGVIASIVAASAGDDWARGGTRTVEPWQWFPDPWQLRHALGCRVLRVGPPAWPLPSRVRESQ